jgi:hypothetical protein
VSPPIHWPALFRSAAKVVGVEPPTVGEAYSLGGAFVTTAWRERETERLADGALSLVGGHGSIAAAR